MEPENGPDLCSQWGLTPVWITRLLAAEEAAEESAAFVGRPANGRRILVRRQALDIGFGEVDLDAFGPDSTHALGRHEPLPGEKARLDRDAGEDICVGITHDAAQSADALSVGADHLGAGLERLPGDLGLAQTDRPATRQTGPCVATWLVAERTRRKRRLPVMDSSSSRSRQRRTMEGAVP
jgi:hypothetical protein